MSAALADWPALVLTAGLATRLRPLSLVRAKAALPVAGEPLVGRILRWLRSAGVRRAVLNLHHLPETVTRSVGDGGRWGLEVRYSWEPQVLGSAGGPRRALDLLDAKRFLIVNGDTLTDCDLTALAQQHVSTGARVTMAVVPRRLERAVLADEDGRVTGFGPGTEHFIGVQAVDAEVFAAVSSDTPSETVKWLYPRVLAETPGAIRVYRSGAELLDVGTAADYLATVDLVARREGRSLDRGVDVTQHPTAHVEHSILWDRIDIGEGARLVDCIVADGVVVPAGAEYQRRVLVQSEAGLVVSPI